MDVCYNLRNPAVKRLMREAEELKTASEEYYAQPVEGNLFEWHFTVSGPPKTDFDGGIYHGRITLPPDYPMKPPSIILLTPNGRFEINKKICLSISGHHPESWQPSWSIRTALLAIIGFMPTHGNGAIGSLDYSPEERQILAQKSRSWVCPECGPVVTLLLNEPACTNMNDSEVETFVKVQVPISSSIDDTINHSMKNGHNLTNSSDVSTTRELNISEESNSFINSKIPVINHNISRQRIVPHVTLQQVQQSDSLVRTESQTLSGIWTTVCMYAIVFMITALLLRRLVLYC